VADQSAVGTTSERREIPLERGKIREFARATMSESPTYVDDPAPVVPPTFLTTVRFWMPEGEQVHQLLGLDLHRVLHGGQEYVFHGPPPRAGTTLEFRTRVDKVYEKEGRRGGRMTFVEAVTEFRDPGGRLVAEARQTIIETAARASGGS
jgi:hypothetical protein